MEDGQNGELGQNVLQVVDLELSQDLELALHQNHHQMDYLAQEKIQKLNHVRKPDVKVRKIRII